MEHIAAMRPALEVEVAEIIVKYRELLLAVGTKYPGETRHQTALRYIRQAEERAGIAAETIAAFKAEARK